MSLYKCPHCGKVYNGNEFYCPKDNYRLEIYTNTQQSPPTYENNKNIPRCPTCNSTNISKISAVSKIAGAATLGLFSKTSFSQFKCNNCGYKW